MLESLLHGDWRDLLKDEMNELYFKSLEKTLVTELSAYEVYPSMEDLFHAFNSCSYENTKVVIVGQDPYINAGQSDGMAFSVKPDQHIPPTLLNIFKALKNDVGCAIPNNGCLEPWAQQGVLLLNSILTVRGGSSKSHVGLGWERFTDAVIKLLNQHHRSLVFMLWGATARKKTRLIDKNSHLVLQSNHPSPIIACNTFASCDHFSKANTYLYETSPSTIDWQIKDI